jgi:RNA polymerase sigma factor (sigma-70 family)
MTTRSRSMMAAVVIGTALSLSPDFAKASENVNSISTKSVEDISKYCQACWRNARLPVDRWLDCTQQVFIRLLERLPTSSWSTALKDADSTERQEFVRAIDTVKKRTQRTKKYSAYSTDITDFSERISNTVAEQRSAVNEVASSVLSPRQQKIVELSFNGWAVPEIAQELGTTVQRVSDEKYKAVQKLKSKLA